MTVEERLDRIEHLSVGWLEERRRDHEEYIRRWRDTQEQIDTTWKAIHRLAEEARSAAVEFRTMLAEMRIETERRDQKTDERIQTLVSSIGDLIRAMRPKDLQ